MYIVRQRSDTGQSHVLTMIQGFGSAVHVMIENSASGMIEIDEEPSSIANGDIEAAINKICDDAVASGKVEKTTLVE